MSQDEPVKITVYGKTSFGKTAMLRAMRDHYEALGYKVIVLDSKKRRQSDKAGQREAAADCC